MSTPLLQVDNVASGYGVMTVLAGVSLHVDAGETIAVVGGNGAGKTTLIRTIAGMLPPRSGRVLFEGRDITGWPADAVCELGLAQVPEGRQLFPSLRVEENLHLGAILKRARPYAKQSLQQVYALFPKLQERRQQYAGTLSGGEQQMLAIGRALMARPVLIMLDEPSLGLSPLMVELMFQTVTRLAREGMSIVLVEQNVAESLGICERAYVLENGEVAMTGASADLLADDRLRQAYLGL